MPGGDIRIEEGEWAFEFQVLLSYSSCNSLIPVQSSSLKMSQIQSDKSRLTEISYSG